MRDADCGMWNARWGAGAAGVGACCIPTRHPASRTRIPHPAPRTPHPASEHSSSQQKHPEGNGRDEAIASAFERSAQAMEQLSDLIHVRDQTSGAGGRQVANP